MRLAGASTWCRGWLRRRGSVLVLALALALSVAPALSAGAGRAETPATPATAATPATPATPATTGRATEAPATVDDLLRSIEPWLVALRVERQKDIEVPQGELPFGGVAGAQGESKDYFARPSGWVTGVLVDPRGFVLTSDYNVAGELRSIVVRLPSGVERGASVLARSEFDDLALLELEGNEPAVDEDTWDDPPWAESVPRSGRIVFAVGRAPDPARSTITDGVISALGRNGDRAIQVDAKLNYGNVGGPLVDLDGRLVGITGFVGHTYPQWGFNSGIGFATSARTIRELLPRLSDGRDVEIADVPFLGVQSEVVESEVRGAPVLLIIAGSSAEKAGVQKGDVIVEFNGHALDNFNQLRFLIFARRVGETVTFKVRRGEAYLDLEGVLGKRPASS